MFLPRCRPTDVAEPARSPTAPPSTPQGPAMTARTTRRVALALTALLTASLAACSSSAANDDTADAAATPSESAALAEAPELRLGYFANLTHANALVGVDDGTYQKALGDTKLTTQIFNAGPAAVEGL